MSLSSILINASLKTIIFVSDSTGVNKLALHMADSGLILVPHMIPWKLTTARSDHKTKQT